LPIWRWRLTKLEGQGGQRRRLCHLARSSIAGAKKRGRHDATVVLPAGRAYELE